MLCLEQSSSILMLKGGVIYNVFMSNINNINNCVLSFEILPTYLKLQLIKKTIQIIMEVGLLYMS